MNNDVTTVISRPSNTAWTSAGQDQRFNDSQSQATFAMGMQKGGLRGPAMVVFMIAELVARRKAIDLAEDYYKLNKKDFDFFKSTYQPAMAASATEVMSGSANPLYTPDYFASMAAGVSKASIADKQWFETRRRMHRYAIGAQRKVDYDFAVVRSHAVIAGWNIARRYEYTYAQIRNNRRFDRQIGIANVGIGVGNVVRQGLAAATGRLATAYDSVGDTVASIGNGLASFSGYKAGRRETGSRYKENGGES